MAAAADRHDAGADRGRRRRAGRHRRDELEFRSRTVRGQVGTLDPSSAADYNLQVKLARADAQATPRGRGQAAPSFVGDDGAAPANPLADMSNANHLAGLSHAEKLKRMRELRQASMGTPRAAAATEM